MPYLTTRKKPKATTKPWFSRLLRHPARKRSGSILVHNTHPGPTRGARNHSMVSYYTMYETKRIFTAMYRVPPEGRVGRPFTPPLWRRYPIPYGKQMHRASKANSHARQHHFYPAKLPDATPTCEKSTDDHAPADFFDNFIHTMRYSYNTPIWQCRSYLYNTFIEFITWFNEVKAPLYDSVNYWVAGVAGLEHRGSCPLLPPMKHMKVTLFLMLHNTCVVSVSQ